MGHLQYARPTTVEEACSLLEDHGDAATVLAGGQSLLPSLRTGECSADFVVDINRIEGCEYVSRTDGELRVGFLARYVDVLTSSAVGGGCEMLTDAVTGIGDVQVRNRGTVCGSIAQADPRGDPPVVATALDAEIVLRDADGTRTVGGRAYFTEQGAGKAPEELVTEVAFPVLEPPYGGAYETYEPSEVAFPVATVATVVGLDGDRVADATIVTGAVEGTPTPMPWVARSLEGEAPTDETLRTAAERVGGRVRPSEDAEGSAAFKATLCRTLTYRALRTATDRARGGR